MKKFKYSENEVREGSFFVLNHKWGIIEKKKQ